MDSQIWVTSADGSRIGYEVVGDGPPLLLVHGGTTDRLRWAPVRAPLAERFRLILMDRRGRGLSVEEAPGPYALEREAEDVQSVLESLGEPARVLGHSYGGTCALEAAAGFTGIERLLIYEPGFSADGTPVFPEEILGEVEDALAHEDRERALEIFFSKMLQLDQPAIDAMRDTPIWQARLEAAPTLAREARAANAYRLSAERYATISAPVRFLLGTETVPALEASTRAAHAALPDSELRQLPGQGHLAMQTDPEGFVAAVDAWLG